MSVKNRKRKTVKDKANMISFVDQESKHTVQVDRYDFEKELLKIHNRISQVLSRVDTLGKYKLGTIDLSIGVSGGIIALTVEGGITLTYS
jgi:hypothetical protein